MTGNIHKNTGCTVFGRVGLLCLMAVLTMAGLNSCDKVIYDYEGDCSVHYLVQFRYDYNMKWADAFAHEVESVTLYVIDEGGNVVWEKTEEGPALAQDGYAMEVDVDPGRYSLLAWCGTKDNGSFIVPETNAATGLTCTLETKTDASGGQYVDGEIDRLYYGWLDDQEFGEEEGDHYYVVPLIKDTNTVRVVVQQVSGGYVDKDDFTFKITADNGRMDWDNSLVGDETLTYYAFYTAQGEAEFGTGTSGDEATEDSDNDADNDASDETDTGVSETASAGTKAATRATYSAAIAEFTIGRMVRGHGMQLSVLSDHNGESLSIPLIDIAVMLKGYYNQALSDQEFLDRQDEYNLIFFLDEGYRWITNYIYINSWKVVLQDVGL